MRSTLCLLLPLSLLFTSCAYEGVVVKKNSRPHPFYDSLGVEEMDSIELRDSAGVVHRQMVTPDVYARYEHGQYFNDLQPAPNDVDKEMEPILVPMRPIKPIAGGYGRAPGNGTIAAKQSTNGSGVGSKRTGAVVAARSSVGTRAPVKVANTKGAVATHAVRTAPAAKRPVVAAAKPEPARKVAPSIAQVNQPAPAAPTKPVVSTNIAHFSAEIAAPGLRPINRSASATTVSTSAATKHPTRKSSSVSSTSSKSRKAKSLMKAPSVETRSEADNATPNESSR